MRHLARLISEIVLPGDCAGCGLPGASICASCRGALRRPEPPWCEGCGHPWPATAVARCSHCLGPTTRARHAVAYDGPVPAIVSGFKDGGRPRLAGPLADLIVESLEHPGGGRELVPVPAGRAGRRRRGYDQASLLADRLGRAWDLPVSACLRRTTESPPQRGASRTDRLRQVVGAFTVVGAPPAQAVLVDDVHTTGATLASCARTLRRAGCAEVTVVCLARVWAS